MLFEECIIKSLKQECFRLTFYLPRDTNVTELIFYLIIHNVKYAVNVKYTVYIKLVFVSFNTHGIYLYSKREWRCEISLTPLGLVPLFHSLSSIHHLMSCMSVHFI